MTNNSLLVQENVHDYRFNRFIKDGIHGYASGLAINPSHLPSALTDMLKDGWKLTSAIGDATDTTKVGFFFEKTITKQDIADKFYNALAHGDSDNRQWLRDKCDEIAESLYK